MAYNVRPSKERFQEKFVVNVATGCHIWIASSRSNAGGIKYGQFAVRRNGKCATMKASRFAYIMAHGDIPHGMVIDHLCRNTMCVNPLHLEAVTTKENIRRGLNGVLKTHCPQGHVYSGRNVYVTDGRRQCGACSRIRAQKQRERRKQFDNHI